MIIRVESGGYMYAVLWLLAIIFAPPVAILFYGSAHPVWYSSSQGTILSWFLFAANILLVVFVWLRTSSSRLSFWRGMAYMGAKSEVGCLNISVIVVPVYLMIMYPMAIAMSIIGLARGKSFTEDWWIRHVVGEPPVPKPHETLLSIAEDDLMYNASLRGFDVKRPPDLRQICDETGIDAKRILDYVSHNPKAYKRWKNAARIERKEREGELYVQVEDSTAYALAHKIYLIVLFVNPAVACGSMLWSDAVMMFLWKAELVFVVFAMPYDWLIKRVLRARLPERGNSAPVFETPSHGPLKAIAPVLELPDRNTEELPPNRSDDRLDADEVTVKKTEAEVYAESLRLATEAYGRLRQYYLGDGDIDESDDEDEEDDEDEDYDDEEE
jgi:hypothetical protein